MALLKNIPYFIIGSLLLYILFLQECKRPKVVKPTIKVDTIVIKDTFYQQRKTYNGKIVNLLQTIADEFKVSYGSVCCIVYKKV